MSTAQDLVRCDGACDEHSSDVVRVHVTDPASKTMTDWGEFNYCAEAIREDRSRGLRVEIVTPNVNAHVSDVSAANRG